MIIYQIDKIHPKDGSTKCIHSVLLGKQCQIMELEIGRRGWLLVDVGDDSFGPHRIALSNVLRIEGEDDICIETENTIYHLIREDHPEEYLQAFEEHVRRLRGTMEHMIANSEKHEGGQGGG